MGNCAPNPVIFVVDSQNSHRNPGASGGPPSFRIATKAINASIHCHKHTVCIYHTHGADISVPHRIFAKGFFIGVFFRLFDGSSCMHMTPIASVDRKDFYDNTLPGLKFAAGIQ